jgi:Spy/CpxP family protein refolding chaperone
MLGLIVGTVCLMGLVVTLKRRRHYHRAREFYGFHHHHDRGGPWGWRRSSRTAWGHPGGRRRDPIHLVFAQLDCTPGQEKAVLASLDGLRARLANARAELDVIRRELSSLLASDVLDQAAVDAATARQNALFGTLSAELRELLSTLHEVLDPEQRRGLAELLADGSLFQQLRGHYVGSRHAHDDFADPFYAHHYAC